MRLEHAVLHDQHETDRRVHGWWRVIEGREDQVVLRRVRQRARKAAEEMKPIMRRIGSVRPTTRTKLSFRKFRQSASARGLKPALYGMSSSAAAGGASGPQYAMKYSSGY